MPVSKPRSTTLSRARQLLRGVARDDSDDELGLEDHPWEWIRSSDREDVDDNGELRIIGARFGEFETQIGDCLLIKGEGLKGEAYVGMACEFEEEDGEMKANVMWFSTESEVKIKKKKRTDNLENEIYLNPTFDTVPLPSINGRAIVLSKTKYDAKYPAGIAKKSNEAGKVFICRRGCNPRTATYTDEFVWDDIWHGRDTDIGAIINMVKKGTTATRKKTPAPSGTPRGTPRKRKNNEADLDFVVDDEETILPDDDAGDQDYGRPPQTPSRKRQRSAAATPSRGTPRSARKFTTPTHKRIVIKKPLLFTPLSTRHLTPTAHLSTPYALARHRLHVSTLPASLPCREAEFTEVYTHLSAAITEGTGSCIYISGTPGTGKTATVREVISQLQALVASEELDDFTFLELNGMKLPDPHQSYSLLWEALKGERVSPSQALSLLEREFSTPSPRRVPCVVLMDELDQLVTRGQGVMYNFFNWPSGRHSRLIVLAVANTMDLPERTLSNKISSRLGLTRITFPGYNHTQLQTIVASRLEGVSGDIVDSDAIQFASRKVAAVSGDARRALDICRRAVELVEGPEGRVTINAVKKAITESTASPLLTALKLLPVAGKVLLAAILARGRRSGVAENALSEVYEEAERMVGVTKEDGIRDVLNGGGRAAGMAAALACLVDAGVVGVEGRRGERGARVRVLVGEDDVKAALRGDKEVGAMVGG